MERTSVNDVPCPIQTCRAPLRHAGTFHKNGVAREDLFRCDSCRSLATRPLEGDQSLGLLRARCPDCPADREMRPEWHPAGGKGTFALRCPEHGLIALARAKHPSGYVFVDAEEQA